MDNRVRRWVFQGVITCLLIPSLQFALEQVDGCAVGQEVARESVDTLCRPELIPADVKLVFHADFRASESSRLFEHLLADLSQEPAVRRMLDGLPDSLSFVKGVEAQELLVTTSKSINESVLLLRFERQTLELEKRLAEVEGAESIKLAGRDAFQFTVASEQLRDWAGAGKSDPEAEEKSHTIQVVVLSNDVIALGMSSGDLTQAVNRFVGGEVPSLDKERFQTLVQSGSRDAFMTVSVGGFDSFPIPGMREASLAVAGDDKIQLEFRLAFRDEWYAKQYESLFSHESVGIKVEALAKQFQLAEKQAKASGKERGNIEIGERDNRGRRNSFLLSLSYNADDLDRFREELNEIVEESLQVKRDGAELRINWASYGTYESTVEQKDGGLSILLFAKLLSESQGKQRLAESSKAEIR